MWIAGRRYIYFQYGYNVYENWFESEWSCAFVFVFVCIAFHRYHWRRRQYKTANKNYATMVLSASVRQEHQEAMLQPAMRMHSLWLSVRFRHNLCKYQHWRVSACACVYSRSTTSLPHHYESAFYRIIVLLKSVWAATVSTSGKHS